METISNQAHVSFSYEGSDVTITNHSNIVNSTMIDKYSLSATKSTSSNCFRPGDTITYFINVTNNGCGCLRNFIINDNLGGEDNLTFVDGSARLFIGGSMTEVSPSDISPLKFEISNTLNRNEELILQYSVVVNENISTEIEEITNTATITGYPCGCNCNNSNNSVSIETSHTIEKCLFADVLITKAVSSDNFCCDDELDYYITLTNIGNMDATNVIVTDTLPASFTATEISMENNGNHYKFDESEYDIDNTNLLTLPNETGTVIMVPAIAPGVDNTTRIKIHGHM